MAVGEPITVTAMTAAKTMATAAPIGLIVAMLIAFIRSRPELLRIKQEGDAAFAARMMARVEDLERRLAKAEADLQVTRHQLNNERQAFDMLIMMMETNPDNVADNLERVKQYRAVQRNEIATEKGAIAGAAVRRKTDDD